MDQQRDIFQKQDEKADICVLHVGGLHTNRIPGDASHNPDESRNPCKVSQEAALDFKSAFPTLEEEADLLFSESFSYGSPVAAPERPCGCRGVQMQIYERS